MKKNIIGRILSFATISKFRSAPLPKEAPWQYYPKLKLYKLLTPNNKYFIHNSHIGVDLFFSHCPVFIANVISIVHLSSSHRRKLVGCIENYGCRVTRDAVNNYYRENNHNKLGILLYQIVRNYELTIERHNM